MKRRALLGALAVAIGPSFTLAQPVAGSMPRRRIGMLGNQDNPPWDGLRQGLREFGYVDGQNASFEWRWSDGDPARLPALAQELVALRPDVIVTSGTQAARAAADATSTIPIVMALSQHPEELGLVKSLARPGGNLTGLSTYSPQLTAKRIQLLKEVAPRVTRLAVIWSPESASQRIQYKDLLAIAPVAGVTVQSLEVNHPEELDKALAVAGAGGTNALMSVGNAIAFKGRQRIADVALKQRLPSVFEERLFVEAGGLLSYGPNFRDLFHRAASYVDRILKGARPQDLPLEQPVRFELIINRRTATALGLTLSSALLLRAESILE